MINLNHRLCWPLCLALATIALLGTYQYIAAPLLESQRGSLNQLQLQNTQRQESLALAPLHGLIDKAMQPLPTAMHISATLRDRLSGLPITNPHFNLVAPVAQQTGGLDLQSQRLILTFQAESIKSVKAAVAAMPGLFACHTQLVGLSIDRNADQEAQLAVRADFQLIGMAR